MAKDDARDNHKYYARVHTKTVRGRKIYRYFYDKAEYQAYLKGTSDNAVPEKNRRTKTQTRDEVMKVINDTIPEKNRRTTPKTKEVKEPTIEPTKPVPEPVDKDKKEPKKETKKKKSIFSKIGDVAKSVVNAGKKFVQSIAKTVDDAADDVKDAGKDFIDNYIIKKPKLKTRDYTKDEDMSVVNPDYSPYDYGTSQNCAYCTATYDLRQRGYDVEAIEKSVYTDYGLTLPWKEHIQTSLEHIESWYEGAESTYADEILEEYNVDDETTWDELAKCVEDKLRKNGEGSYGHFMLYWQDGGGHDVIWAVENGEVILRDCQTNEKHKVIDYLQYCKYFIYFRSDNLKLSDKIWDVVKNR